MSDDKTKVVFYLNIQLTKEVRETIEWLTRNYKKEISGWLAGEVSENTLIIDEILFHKQDVTSASIDTIGKDLIALRKEYGEKCERIIGHWHSHHDMGANWSLTDEEFIDEFSEPRDLVVYMVSSIDDGIRTRVELRKPFKISFDKVVTRTIYNDEEFEAKMKKIIEDKVVEVKYTTIKDEKEERQETLSEDKFISNYVKKRVLFNKSKKTVTLEGVSADIMEKFEDIFDDHTPDITKYPNMKFDMTWKFNGKKAMKKAREELIICLKQYVKKEKELREKREGGDVPEVDWEDYEHYEDDMIQRGYDPYGFGGYPQGRLGGYLN